MKLFTVSALYGLIFSTVFFPVQGPRLLAADSSSPAACQENGTTLCSEARPDPQRAAVCSNPHDVTVSTGCTIAPLGKNPAAKKPAWQLEKERVDKAWDACEPDVEKFCEGIQAGKGRVESCLAAHSVELSTGCVASRTHH